MLQPPVSHEADCAAGVGLEPPPGRDNALWLLHRGNEQAWARDPNDRSDWAWAHTPLMHLMIVPHRTERVLRVILAVPIEGAYPRGVPAQPSPPTPRREADAGAG